MQDGGPEGKISGRYRRRELLCLWDFPGKSTGVGCHFLFQRIFPTQGSNPGLPHCRQTLYQLSHQGSRRENRGGYQGSFITPQVRKIAGAGSLYEWTHCPSFPIHSVKSCSKSASDTEGVVCLHFVSCWTGQGSREWDETYLSSWHWSAKRIPGTARVYDTLWKYSDVLEVDEKPQIITVSVKKNDNSTLLGWAMS